MSITEACPKLLPSTTLYYKGSSLYYKACTKLNYSPVLLCTTKLAQTTSQYYFALQSLHRALPSTTVYYKSLHKALPQYYFVLQSLHKLLPSTTLYYKACTEHFPVLLCTTKLAQKYFPVYTTLYYKACTKHFPVLLCTTKLAQTTSQYYFVLQSLHKALPSTTVYYKACTNKLLPSTTVTKQPYAAITMRSAETELQNTIELRATVSAIAAPKPDLDAKAEKKTILKHFLKGFLEGKSLAPKIAKICDKSLSQPGCSTQYDLQSSTAKYNSIAHAAAAPSNLHAAIPMRFWETELQNTIEIRRNGLGNCSSKTRSRRQNEKRRFWSTF